MSSFLPRLFAVAAIAAFLVAAPAAFACDKDCDCMKRASQGTGKSATPDAKPAPAQEKAAPKAAPSPDAKGAKSGEKAELTGASPVIADADCKCEKGGKNCTCKKGECRCANCGAHRQGAAL